MNPDELFTEIRNAFARHEDDRLTELCNEHADDIVQHFGSWLKVPQQIRGDRIATEAWIEPLLLIARLFEDAGYPGLMERLSGGADNPVRKWRSCFAIASQLVDTGKYDDAAAAIQSILPELQHASGTAVDDIRPKLYGLLAKAQLRKGEIAQGKRFVQMALEDCQRIGDLEGIRTYMSNYRLMEAVELASSGDEGGKALLGIRAEIAHAQELSDKAEFEKSNRILFALIGKGTHEVLEFHSKVWGLLGLNFYRLGNPPESQHYTQKALEECQKSGDADGIRIYSANLQHIANRTLRP